MMNFEVVTAALIRTLGTAAQGRFEVIGYRRQGADAAELDRRVQVYYSAGEFPKSAGRQTGAAQHRMTYNVDLSVSAATQVNLSIINSPSATPTQIAAALAAMQDAAYRADLLMDELTRTVYQILMDGRNFDLGLKVGTVSSRWVDSMRKDDPQPNGVLVVLTGRIQYSCQTVEDVVGDKGLLATGGIRTVIDIAGDDIERTGVEV
jgi:hypothetical protein